MSPVDIAIDNCHPTIFLKLFNKGGLITISHELIFTMFMEFPDVIKTIVHHQRSILKPPGVCSFYFKSFITIINFLSLDNVSFFYEKLYALS